MKTGHAKNKTIWVVVGTRPEVIKQAPLIKALRSFTELDTYIVSTGQHRDTISLHLKEFDLEIDLEFYCKRYTELGDLAGDIYSSATRLLSLHKPNLVVVQGDTTSAAMVALSAFYLQIPVVHLEAGLRTGDIKSPYPEEANRKIIAQIASLHLCPTQNSIDNLTNEGFNREIVILVGNTVVDSLMYMLESKKAVIPSNQKEFIGDSKLILVTSHRRESWGTGGLQGVSEGIRSSALNNPAVKYIVLLHPNPIPRKLLEANLFGLRNVLLLEHQTYSVTCGLLERSDIIVTDSGGIQEEALSLGKITLVTRENTERIEGLSTKLVTLVGTNSDNIYLSIQQSLKKGTSFMQNISLSPYGDGKSGHRSADAISKLLLH